MTYYVPKSDFVAGGVANANDLMQEFYGASDALYRIDQNNLAKESIGTTVPISIKSHDPSENQRGVTCFYTGTGVLTTGSFSGTLTEKDVWQSIAPSGVSGLSFTTRMSGIYTFLFQGTLSSHASAAAEDWLNVDVVITLNGSSISPVGSFSSFQSSSNNAQLPMYLECTRFIEPGDYTVGVSVKPRLRGDRFPSLGGLKVAVFGLMR